MRLEIRRGSLAVLVTPDMERINQAVKHNPGYMRYRRIDIMGRAVYMFEGGVWRPVVYKVQTEQGVVKKVKKSPMSELKDMPSVENTFYLVQVTGMVREAVRPSVHQTSAALVVTSTLDWLPDTWLPYFDDFLQDDMVDSEDIAEVLGYVDERVRGLTYGELVALKSRVGNLDADAIAAEAAKIRVKRFAALGLKPENNLPRLDDIPLDSYFREHLRRHLRLGACVVLVGPPGSGKTFIASAMAGSMGLQTYTTSAARFLEAGRDTFSTLMLTLRYAASTSIIINEFDRLVSSEQRIKTAFLTYLEKRPPSWIAGTAVNLDILLESSDSESGHPELVRPGRVDEVIPVPPPRERSTIEAIVRSLLDRYRIQLDDIMVSRIVRAVKGEALYPSDYLALIMRAASGEKHPEITVDTIARERQLSRMVELLERHGLTSPKLLEKIIY